MPDYGDVFGQRTDQPEAGAYYATLVKVAKATSKKDGSEFRLWTFEAGEGKRFTGTTSLALTPSSKAYRWGTVLLGEPPKSGTKLSDLLERECIAVVEHNTNGYATVTDIQPVPDKAEQQALADEPVGF